MKTTQSRQLARRIIGIAAGIAFLIFWGAMILVMRPKIEERLRNETLSAISANSDAASVSVSLRGRTARLSAEFETEEARGRFQSFAKNLSIPGVREIDQDFTVVNIEMADPDFRLAIRADEASISGLLGDLAALEKLTSAVQLAANGLPVKGEIVLGQHVNPALWAEPLSQFLPQLAASASSARIRISNGTLRISGEAMDDANKEAINTAVQALVATGLSLTDEITVAVAEVIIPDVPTLEVRTYGKKVVVRGLLPIGTAREVILGAVQQGSEPGTVEDSLVVRENVAEPLWLPSLARLSPVLLNSTTEPILSVSEKVIMLFGEARDDEARNEMESLLQLAATASGLPGESALTIPAPQDPVAITLSNTGSVLHLAGSLPDESFHQQLLTAIRRGSANLPLTDEALIGENVGVPKWGANFEKFITEFLIHAEHGDLHIDQNRLQVDAFAADANRAEAIELAVKYLDGSGLELLPMQLEVAKAPEPEAITTEPVPVVETTTPQESNTTVAGTSLKPPSFLNDYIIYFEHGTALLKKPDVDRLRAIAAKMKENDAQKFVIAAFSDSSGDREFNSWLRDERAEAVRAYLSKFGVKAASLSTKGFGSLGPKNAAKDDPRLREFRRVEILVETSENPVTEREPGIPGQSNPSTDVDARSLARFFGENPDGSTALLASLENSRILAWAVAHSGRHSYSLGMSDETPSLPMPDDSVAVPRAVPVIRPNAIGTIYFEHGTAMLKSKGSQAVRALAQQLLADESDAPFYISGYADPVGDPEFNDWLSEERAKAVRDTLIDAKVPASRLRIRAHGPGNLVSETETEEGLRLNRRVEIQLGY